MSEQEEQRGLDVLELTGFEIIEKIGVGGMATVWKARQISLDRIVAIKILSSRLARDPADLQRFKSEAQAAAKLKHPGIVQVYDARVENDIYYFVMEYIAGYTVGDWLRRKAILPEKDAILVAECVADALDYAWITSAMIHCDVKPDNVIVDADGTVKVTDLGLARTISYMNAPDESEEIMGTPVYMSPEQAVGEADLDCRTDIYSLGAMLYHLLTGDMLFEGHEDDEIMQMQVNANVADAMDVNPEASKPVCWLLEKMLCKNPADRHIDWAEVKRDIERVKHGYSPAGKPPPEGASTMTRSKSRTTSDFFRLGEMRKKKERSKAKIAAVFLSILAVVLAGIGVVTVFEMRKRADERNKIRPTQVDAASDRVAREMYEYAVKWAAANPDQHDEGVANYEKVISHTKGTKYTLMAEERIRRIRERKDEEIRTTVRNLSEHANRLSSDGMLSQAVSLVESYQGRYAEETKAEREKLAAELKAKHARLEKEKTDLTNREQRRFQNSMNVIASELLTGGCERGLRALESAVGDPGLADHRGDFDLIEPVLRDASRIDDRIIDSFRRQIGQEISVRFGVEKEKRTFFVKAIDGREIRVRRTGVPFDTYFKIEELAPSERLARMGSNDQPEVALVKGMLAYKAGALESACSYFEKTPRVLAEALLVKLNAAMKTALNANAERDLRMLIQSLGASVDAGPFNADAWIRGVNDALKGRDLTPEEKSRIQYDVESQALKYKDTDFIKTAKPLTDWLLKKAQ